MARNMQRPFGMPPDFRLDHLLEKKPETTVTTHLDELGCDLTIESWEAPILPECIGFHLKAVLCPDVYLIAWGLLKLSDGH